MKMSQTLRILLTDFGQFVALLFIASLIWCSCNRHSSPAGTMQKQTRMTWLEQLNASRPMILTGEWNHAESSWAHLVRDHYSEQESREWVKLQVDVLEQTRNDRLKSGLRMSAIQEMFFYPDISRQYLGWLKEGIATNLFVETNAASKAQELVDLLEKGPDLERYRGKR
jgi:hypothetical protein